MKIQIFISYRRIGGDVTAHLFYERLKSEGYSVFIDVESLGSGKFGNYLLDKINECSDFIIILDSGTLDRCWDRDDWVRKEIEKAIEEKKNIIPVLAKGFVFPEKLPDSIAVLTEYNGITANMELFAGVMGKLQKMLEANPYIANEKDISKFDFDSYVYLKESTIPEYVKAIGLYNEKKYKEAFEILLDLALSGNSMASAKVGMMYSEGKGCEQDYEEAAKYYQMSADRNNPLGYVGLSDAYRSNHGLPYDLEKSAILYGNCESALEKLCILNDSDAQFFYAKHKYYGIACQEDCKCGIYWYNRAAKQNNLDAVRMLAWSYLDNKLNEVNVSKAMELLKQAEENGDSMSAYVIGEILFEGVYLPCDYKNAFVYLKKAAAYNNEKAEFRIAYMYYFGCGVQVDYNEVLYWLNRANSHGDPEAAYGLGNLYRKGQGVEQSFEAALKWYKIAVERGNIKANRYIGILYENGQGVEKNISQAKEYYKMAADKGDEESIERLKKLTDDENK